MCLWSPVLIHKSSAQDRAHQIHSSDLWMKKQWLHLKMLFSCKVLGNKEGDDHYLIVSVLGAELLSIASVSPWSCTCCYLTVTFNKWQKWVNDGGKERREHVKRRIAFTRYVSEEYPRGETGRGDNETPCCWALTWVFTMSSVQQVLPPSLPASTWACAASGSGPCFRPRGERSWRKQNQCPAAILRDTLSTRNPPRQSHHFLRCFFSDAEMSAFVKTASIVQSGIERSLVVEHMHGKANSTLIVPWI